MRCSVLIPTFNRPRAAAACVSALARELPRDAEVLVGIDGPDDGTVASAADAWRSRGGSPDRLRVEPGPRAGQASVRNRLLPLARGRTLLFLNDDMIPAPGMIDAHLDAQDRARAERRPALVIGDSPFVVPADDRLFDRLIRETSMIFFYDRMNSPEARREREAGADRDWGFRHAWLLNLSAPAELVREAGGFTVFPSTYGYEDDELAFRLAERFGARVLYRPDARADHDHRYDPDPYLVREFKLGYAAIGFARTTPECARAMFGRDITSEAELDYARLYVANERAACARALDSFRTLARIPADAIAPERDDLVRVIYQQHLPLKRWMWRAGLIAAREDRPIDGVDWP